MRVEIRALMVGMITTVCGGCVLPLPHWRVQTYGVTGQLVNATDSRPIGGALVASLDEPKEDTHSDKHGNFRLHAKRGWHAAYMIGPNSHSLLPGWDTTPRCRDIRVSAPGYLTADFSIGNRLGGQGKQVSGEVAGAYLRLGRLPLAAAPDASSGQGH